MNRHRTFSRALGIAAFAACTAPALAAQVAAVEFYDLVQDRYLVTANAAEIASFGGGALASFYRSGTLYAVDDAPRAGLAPVCRFASVTDGTPDHLYTASAPECETLKAIPGFTYEGIAFYSPVPDAQGQCGANTSPVYRLYSSTYDGAPMHVYTPYPARLPLLEGLGFAVERVEFCVPTSMDIAEFNSHQVDNSYWRLTGWWAGPHPPVPPTDTGTNTALYFYGTARLRIASDADHGIQDFLSSASPFFIDRSADYYDGPFFQTLGWGPFTNEYEAVRVQYNEASKTGDIIGGAYAIVWTSGSDAQSCARQVLLNRGDDPTGLEVHPFQPLLIVNRFVVCAPAQKLDLPTAPHDTPRAPRGPPLSMAPS